MMRTHYSLALLGGIFVSLLACNSNHAPRPPSNSPQPKPSIAPSQPTSQGKRPADVSVANKTKPHLRAANRAELKKIRRAGAVLRARVYQRQNIVEFPAGFPDVVRSLFLGPEHGKLVGLELFKGMSGLKRKPDYRFARIRYITLASQSSLEKRLGALLQSAGWSTALLPESRHIKHPTLGQIKWLIQETIDQPTVVDIRAELTPKSFGKVTVAALLRRPPSWWPGLDESKAIAYEYSRFHLRKTGAAFTDIERLTTATLPGSVNAFRDDLYAYAKARRFTFDQNQTMLVGPKKETLIVQPGPGGLALVHHQNRWIAPIGKGPFRED